MTFPQPSQGRIEHPGVGQEGQTAVYRVFDADGALLYVGMGRNPMSRWASHSAQHAWWQKAHSFRVEWHATRKEAAAAEIRAIQTECPQHNIHGAVGWGKFVAEAYPKRLEANRRMLAERRKSAA